MNSLPSQTMGDASLPASKPRLTAAVAAAAWPRTRPAPSGGRDEHDYQHHDHEPADKHQEHDPLGDAALLGSPVGGRWACVGWWGGISLVASGERRAHGSILAPAAR